MRIFEGRGIMPETGATIRLYRPVGQKERELIH